MSIRDFITAFCSECNRDTTHYQLTCRECGNHHTTNWEAQKAAKLALYEKCKNPEVLKRIVKTRKESAKKRKIDRARMNADLMRQVYKGKAGIFGRGRMKFILK